MADGRLYTGYVVSIKVVAGCTMQVVDVYKVYRPWIIQLYFSAGDF